MSFNYWTYINITAKLELLRFVTFVLKVYHDIVLKWWFGQI